MNAFFAALMTASLAARLFVTYTVQYSNAVTDGLIMTHWVHPAQITPDVLADWVGRHRLERRQAHAFYHVTFTEAGTIETFVTYDSTYDDTNPIEGLDIQTRLATEDEIFDYITSGLMQEDIEGDAEFERGWNEYRELREC